MSVRIDTLFLPATIAGHDSRWCKLTADSTEELKAFATGKLKLRERYIQQEGTANEHYLLTEPKRLLALKHGAVEVPAQKPPVDTTH